MITSTSNGKVKAVRRLQADRRFREREEAFVVEGTRWVGELIHAAQPPRRVFFTEEWATRPGHQSLLNALSAPTFPVSEAVMAAMSDTHTPAGVLAVVPMQAPPLPDQPTLLLVLDRVRTPGNLGTMLRTAAAAGVDGVLLGPGCVDAYNPKVVRGGMGAQLRLPVRQATWYEIADVTAGMKVWLAAAASERLYTDVDWRQPSALVIGSEAHGAGDKAHALTGGAIAIPMHAKTESLNAAMAAGIILFEAVRQRGSDH